VVGTLLQDLRSAFRSLIKTPSLTLAAVLSLGLGIGANTTVFTWLQAVLLRPIPGAHETSRLYVVGIETRDGRERSWSYPNYRDSNSRATQVQFIAQGNIPLSIAVDGRAERAYGMLVSGEYFPRLGLQPALGRLLSPEDDRTPGGHPVTVLSHSYWQRRFAGDPGIVGRQVTVNNVPMTVIGVAPEGFLGSSLGISSSAWVTMAMQPQMDGNSRLESRGHAWMQVYVRLLPGVTQEQAQAEVDALMSQLAVEHKENEGLRALVVPTWRARWGAPRALAPILGVLAVVVALVLLIACANVANLLLARAVGRRRDVAVRLSLGANRWRLVRQLLTESMLLSGAAGVVGVAMAYWTYGLLMTFVPPTDFPIAFGLDMDLTTFLYAAGVSIVTGLFFGLAPALQTSRPDTIHALKEESGRGASGGRTGGRLRNALVVVQVAVCLVLLLGAALFLRSLTAAQQLSPGFEPKGMLTAAVDLVPNGYTPDTGRQFHRRLTEALAAVPGVQSYALARQLPLGFGGSSSTGLSVDGYTPQENEELNVVYNIVGPRYFETMRIPLAAGREFTPQDARESRRVLIVNETMAKRYWPGRDAVGGRVKSGKQDYEVVGVARDIKYFQLAEDAQPHMYFAFDQSFTSTAIVHVRAAGSAGPVLAAVREVVRSLDPNLPIFDARTMEEHMQSAVFAQKMGANLLGVMGALAVLLAAIGLYGVIAYAVSQRRQELGIRLALGAAPGDLLKMVMRQGMTLTGIGLAIGLALSLTMAGFMGSLLPGIAPYDPVTFVGVPLLLMTIAAIAALIPARRAGAVDPIVALRYE